MQSLKAIALISYSIFASSCIAQEVDLNNLVLPDGFSISVYAEVNGPRQLALGADNIVYVGGVRDRVSAVLDSNGDGSADEVLTVAEGLNTPNGVAYHQGGLYIGEINRISKISNISSRLSQPQATETIIDSLPRERHHGFKFLQIGPDGKMYFPVGGPCNVCLRSEETFATIQRMNLDGGDQEIVAHGVRNTVGFDWHPQTAELWFTDNGRDNLGDNIPACEINRLTEVGQHFGFPFIHQGDLPDPDFGIGKSVNDFIPPVQKLVAHSAPLGLAFYRGTMFPEEYRNTFFVAEHGSWNRSEKSGYRVAMGKISADNSSVTEYVSFLEGFLQGQANWGRPVDILNMRDGSVLISDDMANVIYRVSYAN